MGNIVKHPSLTSPTEFNINDDVTVRLTDRGKEVLLARIQEQREVSANEAGRIIRTHYEDGTYYKFQLYEFMYLFGSSMPWFATSNEKYHLFEQNTLLLQPSRHVHIK